MSKRKQISQREARELRRRVAELEMERVQMFADWVRDYPNGVHIASIRDAPVTVITVAKINTARRLGHAVVVTDSGDELRFYALPAAGAGR